MILFKHFIIKYNKPKKILIKKKNIINCIHISMHVLYYVMKFPQISRSLTRSCWPSASPPRCPWKAPRGSGLGLPAVGISSVVMVTVNRL